MSDIPGNRPEDIAAEELAEKIAECLDKVSGYAGLDDELKVVIEEAVARLCGESYGIGYHMGQADEAMAQAMKDAPIDG